MQEMKHKFQITIGDWSNDGHGGKEVFQISSNVDSFTTKEAWIKVHASLGNPLDRLLSDYEDDALSLEDLKSMGLTELDADVLNIDEHYSEPDRYLVLPETLARIWVYLMNRHSPYCFELNNDMSNINLNIGYGCFI